MPIYTYVCSNCGAAVEKYRPVDNRDDEVLCQRCKHLPLKRVLPKITFVMADKGIKKE
jgi:putative FmdB family regulatory protein